MAERFLVETTVSKFGMKQTSSSLVFLTKLNSVLDEKRDDLSHRDQIFLDKLEDVVDRLREAYSMTNSAIR